MVSGNLFPFSRSQEGSYLYFERIDSSNHCGRYSLWEFLEIPSSCPLSYDTFLPQSVCQSLKSKQHKHF